MHRNVQLVLLTKRILPRGHEKCCVRDIVWVEVAIEEIRYAFDAVAFHFAGRSTWGVGRLAVARKICSA
jgi:hypothetical protein